MAPAGKRGQERWDALLDVAHEVLRDLDRMGVSPPASEDRREDDSADSDEEPGRWHSVSLHYFLIYTQTIKKSSPYIENPVIRRKTPMATGVIRCPIEKMKMRSKKSP